MLAYLDRCRRELDTIETSEEELARLADRLISSGLAGTLQHFD